MKLTRSETNPIYWEVESTLVGGIYTTVRIQVEHPSALAREAIINVIVEATNAADALAERGE